MPGENQPNTFGGFDLPFSGKVKLFPLPNFVLFPHVVRGLHIFEPRYCSMLEEALVTDNLISMATLSRGWESNYQGAPAIEPLVCIGKIIRHQATDDGRHNILLKGIARARIVKEMEQVELFRVADAELIGDVQPSVSDAFASTDRSIRSIRRIFRCIAASFVGLPLATLIQQQTMSDTSVNALSYMIASLLPLPIEIQLALLAETCPRKRIDLIERWLLETTGYSTDIEDSTPPSYRGEQNGNDFPPNFSLN